MNRKKKIKFSEHFLKCRHKLFVEKYIRKNRDKENK